jgi:2-phosphosulfolactate phosphatase
MSTLNVHFLPSLVAAEDLVGATVVVIDVLRATTTITYALAAGASAVIPCLDVGDALRIKASCPAGTVVLGGERGGKRIEGFDLGNSPAEYTPETVGGRVVVFTTTNGTRAIEHCRLATRVLLGAFVNLSAVSRAVSDDENVHLLCAGTRGKFTREDVLLAGAIGVRMARDEAGTPSANWRPAPKFNEQARIAAGHWLDLVDAGGAMPARGRLIWELRDSLGGRDLVELGELGFDADIEAAAETDRFDVVPCWDRDSGAIRAR